MYIPFGRPFNVNRTFFHSAEEVAANILKHLKIPGGYANLVIAKDELDPYPVRYYYRAPYLGPPCVTEGADNGQTLSQYTYRDQSQLYEKLYTLVNSPDFFYVEFMNKGVSYEYHRIYHWQLSKK